MMRLLFAHTILFFFFLLIVEGTFGVPLEVLVDRNGVDSALGAGPGRIRIPSFVDDSITAMRNMGKVSKRTSRFK